jgi:HlyD family secretion protein
MAESKVVTSRQATEVRTDGTTAAPPSAAIQRGAAAAPPKEILKKVTHLKKRRLNPIVLVAGLLLLGAAVWYFFLRTPAKAALVVRYAAVDAGDISRGVTATGTLQATTTVQVGSQVSGMITNLYADFNTKVQKGQLLATLDPATFEAAVTQAKANVSKAQADLTNAKKDEGRQRDLLARQLIAQADYDLSKNKLDDATAIVEQTSAQLKQVEANLNYTIIRSPISGVVVSRNVDKGQTVAAGFNAPVLFVIAQDLTSMQVAAAVDEADIGSVATSQQVKFTVDAYPGEPFTGTVSQVRINSVTLQNVVTYTVIILTPNPDGRLLPGMTATVTIVNASRTGVLRVPVNATRFVPPPELLAQSGIKDTSAAHEKKQRAPGDTSHHGGMRGGGADRPQISTVYVKSNAKQGPSIQPVKIVTGLTDGNYTEILNSTPPLHLGDSIVVAAFSTGTTSAAGASPLNTRTSPGGGGVPRRF